MLSAVRLATWNVWWRFGGNWAEREPGILSTLADVDADVVGLAETWIAPTESQPERFARRLGYEFAVTGFGLPPVPSPPESPDQVGVDMGIGLLSRWPVTRSTAVEMPSPDRPLVALRAELAHPLGPLHVFVACLDWEPDRLHLRAAQLAELGRLATDASLDGPLPVIVMGDFNAGPEAADFAALATVLTDCVAIAADADPDARTLSSDNPFAPLEAALQIDRRIDHLLARPGAPDQRLNVPWSRIVRDRPGGLPPSDHYLVAAELRWG
jgi:endonuclease/exonuclease/phosphatase family metal-dependent hydrolase